MTDLDLRRFWVARLARVYPVYVLALLVALPLKPLCREDCAGLCPQCGANLNEGPCGCEPDTEDDRWAALRELKLEDLPAGDSNLN